MMRFLKIFATLVLIGGSILLYRHFTGANYKNLPPVATGPWIAFGDSLTAGVGGSEGRDYPALLSQDLGVPIQNLGIPGNTTKDGLGRLDQAYELQPRVVLLCLGGNDGLRSLPKGETFANLGMIIEGFQQRGTFVVLIGVHSASILDNNAKEFKKLAKEKGAFYVPDILSGVLGNPSLMSDYIHPNDSGYQKIAERLSKILRPLLPQLQN